MTFSARPTTPSVSNPSTTTRVLVIAKDSASRRGLARALMNEHDVMTAEDISVGASFLTGSAVNVVVLDTDRVSGDEFEDLLGMASGVQIVVLGEESLSKDELSRVFLLLSRASSTEHVAWAVRRACGRMRLEGRLLRLEQQVTRQHSSSEIIGACRAMDEVFELAHTAAVTSCPVVLIGEGGTGKEMLARAIHRQGKRAAGPFVVFECAAMTPERTEIELFGGESNPIGVLGGADQGTLFLADIDSLSLSSQAKVVQFIQHTKNDEPSAKRFDIRMVAASKGELKPLVHEGSFRKDLYFHLNALMIRVPALRRRKEDIALLAYHFLHRESERIGRRFHRISPEALRILRNHRWSGNIRELERAMTRAIAWAKGEVILPADVAFLRDEALSSVALAPSETAQDTAFDAALFELPYAHAKRQAVLAFERAYIRDVLRRTGENVSEAARQSGLDRSNFRRVMKKVQ